MEAPRETASDKRRARQRIVLASAIVLTLPGVAVGLSSPGLPHAVDALVFGLAIIGAAFLLSWAAEVAQLDISAGLAIAVLAFIAVLPEYAVDLVFAAKAGNAVQRFGAACAPPGSDAESACSLALANMTGANRLLIGLGWSMVVFIAWYRGRRRGTPIATVTLGRQHSVELAYLAIATVYSLALPLKHSITPVDALVLVGIFVAYTVRVSRAPAGAPHLVGPAAYIGGFSARVRRLSTAAMFLFSAAVILLSAEPFADALVETGQRLGMSEFLLVQWLAPLASEAPELLVAGLYAWRMNAETGLGTLVSSKVNQWTLLVGTLPIVFAVASVGMNGLPIEPRQREELFLTAAQSVFAVAVLLGLSISVRAALLLFGLFWAQFVIGAIVPDSAGGVELVATGIAYLVLAAGILVRDRERIVPLLRAGSVTPYDRLGPGG